MYQLPNSCYISEMKISPADMSMAKDWFVYYTFFDPEFSNPLKRQIRGMNREKSLSSRLRASKEIMSLELEYLKKGFNPFHNRIIPAQKSELNPSTPFIVAIKKAEEKVKGVKGTLTDIKCVIKGVELSARQLGIDRMAVKDVSRKYFKMIFEKCYENNERFSANRQNVYRKTLKRLFDELIEMEAVESNPLISIRKERIVKKERLLLTDEQRNTINDYLKNNYYNFWRAIQIFKMSGSREIEILRVQVKHINLREQTCLYLVKKGRDERWISRPIVDAAVYLWEEIMEGANSEHYLFSHNLCPGADQLKSTETLSRRWKRHVKKHLKINSSFYDLKYLNTTELMDALSEKKNETPEEKVRGLTAHTSTEMIAKVYDIRNKVRKDDKVKQAGIGF